MCSSLFNNHASLIKSYEKLMRERNILLQENKFDIDWLDTLETQMSQDGVSIGLNRLNLITGLNTRLDNDENPVWPKAFLKIEGIIEDKLSSNDCESAKDFFRERLFDNRKKDFFSGRTTFGIHKSDLLVSDRNKGIYANQCSTGEQKSLLIGLILTHLNLVANRSNRYPILLLDEVVAHLDQLRRAALFEQIIETKAQVFMTGTEIDLFSGIKDFSEIFSVGMGRLKKIN
jgi:DNA replication and repair protein RecF